MSFLLLSHLQVQLTTEQAVHLFSALGIKGLDSRFDFEGLISFSFVTMERNVIKKDGLLVLRPDVDVLVYVAGHGHCEWGGQEWVRLATLLDIAVLFITFPVSCGPCGSWKVHAIQQVHA